MMKNPFLYISALLISSLFFSSCEDFFQTTLEIDPPPHTPQLAVSAFGNTYTNELKVLVTNSVGILEDLSHGAALIDNAEVNLWSGDQLIYTLPNVSLSHGSFNYHMTEGNHTFVKGSEYKLIVTTAEYPIATSTITIPLDINPISVSFEEDGGSDFDSDYSAVDVRFQDPKIQKDFYEVAIVRMDPNTQQFYNVYSNGSFDPAVEEGLANNIINDNSFNGELKNIEFIIDRQTVTEAEDLYIIWNVTPEAHYLHNKTAVAQQNTEDDPFSTPVQLYNNIENGLGIFSIVNRSIIKVD